MYKKIPVRKVTLRAPGGDRKIASGIEAESPERGAEGWAHLPAVKPGGRERE